MTTRRRDTGSLACDPEAVVAPAPRALLGVDKPAVCFLSNIGDAVLMLPALRALAELFTEPLTLICPAVVYDLCFREVSDRHVDTTGLPLTGPRPLPGVAPRAVDYDSLAARIGPVDVFIDTLTWKALSSTVIRPLVHRLSPTTTIGFPTDDGYDFVIAKEDCHAADLSFKLVHLFDPALRIEDYAGPLPLPARVVEQARRVRAAVPAGTKVLVVHADTDWADKRWPITRFTALLDQFLARHPDFVVWVVGMGHESLDAGREGRRVYSRLGLPLDLTMALVAQADLFLGVDSSMLHAADLARVPGVGLFGPTRAATWGFRFGPHRHVERASTAKITVAEVLAALDDLAGAPAPRERAGRTADPAEDPLLGAVLRFRDAAQAWHDEPPSVPPGEGDAGARALGLHAVNFVLWHHEDAVRRAGIDDGEVARRKRSIDELNARRNAAVEDIDATLLAESAAVDGAPLRSETPGSIVDRLSVLALRIAHTARDAEHASRREVLEEQYADLFRALTEYLAALRSGRLRFGVYRQFKSAAQRQRCALFDGREG